MLNHNHHFTYWLCSGCSDLVDFSVSVGSGHMLWDLFSILAFGFWGQAFGFGCRVHPGLELLSSVSSPRRVQQEQGVSVYG